MGCKVEIYINAAELNNNYQNLPDCLCICRHMRTQFLKTQTYQNIPTFIDEPVTPVKSRSAFD
jgi:hypothetical protein